MALTHTKFSQKFVNRHFSPDAGSQAARRESNPVGLLAEEVLRKDRMRA